MERSAAVQRSLSACLVLGLFAVCAWGLARASPLGRSAAPSPAVPRPGISELRGTLEAVDLEGERLTLRTARGQVAVPFDVHTTAFLEGQMTTVMDLSQGGEVLLFRDARDGRAVWIETSSQRPALAHSAAPRAGPLTPFRF